jgi:hypothetical protein
LGGVSIPTTKRPEGLSETPDRPFLEQLINTCADEEKTRCAAVKPEAHKRGPRGTARCRPESPFFFHPSMGLNSEFPISHGLFSSSMIRKIYYVVIGRNIPLFRSWTSAMVYNPWSIASSPVSTSTPSSVMRTVCSACALRAPLSKDPKIKLVPIIERGARWNRPYLCVAIVHPSGNIQPRASYP